MDPQITLTDLLAAVRDNDIEAASDSLESLLHWHRKGGFLPDLRAALDTLAADQDEAQDRESYSDDQDRESYSTDQ